MDHGWKIISTLFDENDYFGFYALLVRGVTWLFYYLGEFRNDNNRVLRLQHAEG